VRVSCVGGGPGGLFVAILLKAGSIADSVTVYERNGPDDTFGFGVVFSDETLDHSDRTTWLIRMGGRCRAISSKRISGVGCCGNSTVEAPTENGEQQVGSGGVSEIQLGNRQGHVIRGVAKGLLGIAAGGVDERGVGLNDGLRYAARAAREQPDGLIAAVARHRADGIGESAISGSDQPGVEAIAEPGKAAIG